MEIVFLIYLVFLVFFCEFLLSSPPNIMFFALNIKFNVFICVSLLISLLLTLNISGKPICDNETNKYSKPIYNPKQINKINHIHKQIINDKI